MNPGGPQRTRPAAEGPPAGTRLRWGARAWRVGTVLWGALVLVGSMLPPRAIAPAMPAFPHADKLAHAGSYAVLGLLAVWGWSRRGWLGLGAAVLLFGIAVEFFQPLTGRSLSGLDMLADAAGVACGMVAAHLAVTLHRRR